MIKKGSKRRQITLSETSQERLKRINDSSMADHTLSEWVEIWINTQYTLETQFKCVHKEER